MSAPAGGGGWRGAGGGRGLSNHTLALRAARRPHCEPAVPLGQRGGAATPPPLLPRRPGTGPDPWDSASPRPPGSPQSPRAHMASWRKWRGRQTPSLSEPAPSQRPPFLCSFAAGRAPAAIPRPPHALGSPASLPRARRVRAGSHLQPALGRSAPGLPDVPGLPAPGDLIRPLLTPAVPALGAPPPRRLWPLPLGA